MGKTNKTKNKEEEKKYKKLQDLALSIECSCTSISFPGENSVRSWAWRIATSTDIDTAIVALTLYAKQLKQIERDLSNIHS